MPISHLQRHGDRHVIGWARPTARLFEDFDASDAIRQRRSNPDVIESTCAPGLNRRYTWAIALDTERLNFAARKGQPPDYNQAVIALRAVKSGVVMAQSFQTLAGQLAVRTFCFMYAEHIGPNRLK